MHEGNQLKFVKLAVDDFEQLEFLQRNLRNFYSREIVNWQYAIKNYSTGLFFVKDKDRYIASQGMIPIYLNIQNKFILTAKSESSFLLPEYRGKGVYEALYFHTISISEEDAVELIWGFTALSKVWRNKLKFDVYDNIILETELQLSLIKALSSTIKSELAVLKKCKASIKAVLALVKRIRLKKTNKEYYSTELFIKNNSHLEIILELYKVWQNKHVDYVSIAPTKDFLEWRIHDNPIIKYRIIGIYKNQNIIGLGIVNDSNVKAYLVDFIVKDTKHLDFCFSELLRYLKQNCSISHLIYWANSRNKYNDEIHSVFKSNGAYCYVNNSMNFVVKKTGKASFDNIDITKYCINGLWTEGFKI